MDENGSNVMKMDQVSSLQVCTAEAATEDDDNEVLSSPNT
jgi:hypothetical protein